LLASALAPPQKRGTNAFFVLLFFGGLFGGIYWYLKYASNGWRDGEEGQKWMGLGLVIFALISGVCGWVWSAMTDGKEHAQAMDQWSKQWFCKKCGHTFTRY
jgi:H+/Cl- antiporter ClcA